MVNVGKLGLVGRIGLGVVAGVGSLVSGGCDESYTNGVSGIVVSRAAGGFGEGLGKGAAKRIWGKKETPTASYVVRHDREAGGDNVSGVFNYRITDLETGEYDDRETVLHGTNTENMWSLYDEHHKEFPNGFRVDKAAGGEIKMLMRWDPKD